VLILPWSGELISPWRGELIDIVIRAPERSSVRYPTGLLGQLPSSSLSEKASSKDSCR
jgi:hypothetical protein